MVALTFTTHVDTVLGTLQNGTKVVSTVLTTANNGTTISQFTIKPLSRVLKFFPVFTTFNANSKGWIYTNGTPSNTIGINPVADSNGACVQIISFGV